MAKHWHKDGWKSHRPKVPKRRERSAQEYNPAMVRRIKNALKGPFIEIPDGDILKWLSEPQNEGQK